MKYKFLVLLFVLLIATPTYGQEPSLVVVETLEPTPTTIKTGELFVQLYRIRYLDLSEEGIDVTINEENLNLRTLGEFEVLSFCIDKGQLSGPCAGLGGGSIKKDFLERTWYLKYTLRIISPKKGTYKIPPMTVFWTEKNIGQAASEAEPKSMQVEKEVFVNYVTTVTENPQLDIRDNFDFGAFSTKSFVYKLAFWFCIAGIPTLWLLLLVVYLRSPASEPKISLTERVADGNLSEGFTPYQPLSKRESFKALRKVIKKFSVLTGDAKNFDGSKIRAELVGAIMDFLKTRTPKSNIGMTPFDMSKFINETMAHTSNGANLLIFSKRALRYQSDLEEGRDGKSWGINPIYDAMVLKKTLSRFRWYWRLINRSKHLFLKIYILSWRIRW